MLPQRWQLLALYACVLTALAWPVLWVDIPVGVDTLNHFARIHVRAHIDTDPDLARLFEVRNVPVPYLGMDLLLTPLARVIPTLTLARLFTVALVWGIVGATAVLQRAFSGRWGWEPLLASLVAWNGLMAWGFLNYVLGMILALLGLVAWHALRAWRWPGRLAVFISIVTGLYFTHLLAALVFGLLSGIHTLYTKRANRLASVAILIASFVPVLVVFASFSAPPLDGATVSYAFGLKLVGLASPFLFSGYYGGVEAGYLVMLGTVILVGYLTVLHPRQLAPLLMRIALVTFSAGVFLPSYVLGIFGLDFRLPVAACCCAIAALKLPLHDRRSILVVGVAFSIFLTVRIYDVQAMMLGFQEPYAELRSSLANIPRGSIIIPLINRTNFDGAVKPSFMYEHFAQLAIIDRSSAATDFFSQLGSVRGRGAAATFKSETLGAVIIEQLPRHGYALMIHLGQSWAIPPGAKRVTQGRLMDVLALP